MITPDDSPTSVAEPGFQGRPDYRSAHLGAATANDYDHDFHDPNTAKGLHWRLEQRMLGEVLDDLVFPRPRVAVDFACGTGRVLSFLEPKVDRTIGINISPDMLAIARARCSRSELLQGDITCGEVSLEPESIG